MQNEVLVLRLGAIILLMQLDRYLVGVVVTEGNSVILVELITLHSMLFQIIIGFLLKGHTHEDIDQRFSKISHGLYR